jgi:hypothetical protein
VYLEVPLTFRGNFVPATPFDSFYAIPEEIVFYKNYAVKRIDPD